MWILRPILIQVSIRPGIEPGKGRHKRRAEGFDRTFSKKHIGMTRWLTLYY